MTRAVFLHSPVGRAHVMASRAIASALDPAWSREELDYLAFLPAGERALWTGLYHLALRHAPGLWRAWRQLSDRHEPRALRDRVMTGAVAFASVVDRVRPRIVVSTIGGGAALAGAARARLGASFVNALVVTHFRAHRHWARREADVVFVSTDAARVDLIDRGVDAARIVIAGTPIRAGVHALDPDAKGALRARLGLGDDPAIVVSSGGTGAYRAHDQLLALLERLGRPLDVLVFRGDAAGVERRGRLRVHHLGYRVDFLDWLCAADVCVGKLGSLTAAEACAAGVPIVVWHPIPGPEEANAAYLVEAGAALWPRYPRELCTAIANVLDGRGASLARAARRLHRPDAAARIARELEVRAC